MASNPGGGFTPLTGRIIDTRQSSSVASNSSLAVQIAGARGGLSSVEGGLAAVAITLTAIHSGTNSGYAKVWGDGMPEPGASAINYAPTGSIRTTTAIVPVGANGKIRIKNASTTATDFVVDLQGAYNSLPGGPSDTNQTGQRKSATTLPFPITDQTNASVDVGTGNLLVTTSALSLPGVTQNATIVRRTTPAAPVPRTRTRWPPTGGSTHSPVQATSPRTPPVSSTRTLRARRGSSRRRWRSGRASSPRPLACSRRWSV